jgi:CRISPR-associated endoribonuclease Cas6
MPSRWELVLAGPAGTPVPLTAPHAVVSGWLDDPPAGHAAGRPGQARRSGHEDQARKWACGPMRAVPASGPGHAVALIALQVRLLDDSLADRLSAAIVAGARVRLGARHFEVTQPLALVEQASWQALRHWPGTRAWQLRFVTPACFRHGNRTSPWPAPEAVARGLADRWRRLDPGTAPPTGAPGPGTIWVSDLDGRNEVQALTRKVRRDGGWQPREEIISGYTGRIRYACDQGADDDAAAFHALMSFAAYAGVGAHTTYGFGVVCPEPTWQPPSHSEAT